MKSIKFILTCFIATSLTTNLSSCSDDDNDGPDMPKVKMGITSMKGGYTNSSYGGQESKSVFSNVEYDSDGRVMSYTDNGISYTPIHYTYEYSQDKITVMSRYGNDTDSSIDKIYNLKNGVIINESKNSISYYYDESNQLNRCSNQYETSTYTWNGGNPVSAAINEYGDTYTVYFQFISEANTLSCFQHRSYSVVYFDFCDPFLMAAGYFGQQPKNLIGSISDGDSLHKFTYSDFNENGYPCSMRVIDEDGDIQEYSFNWEKYN